MVVPAWRENVYVLRGISVKIVKVNLAYINLAYIYIYIYMGVNIGKKGDEGIILLIIMII